MSYEFVIKNEDSVELDGNEFHFKAYYGIDAPQFMAYYSNLKDNYSFKFKEYKFVVDIHYEDGSTKKGWAPVTRNIVNFIIYCNILEEKGLNIEHLVRQIKSCTDLYEVRHASSMAVLCHIYSHNGYTIEFLPIKDADFLIDGIKADLKTFQPTTLKPTPTRPPKLTKKGSLDMGNVTLLGIIQKIKSRFLEGCRQAQLVFYDMADAGLFFVINSTGNINKIIAPSMYRLILFRTSFWHHGSQPIDIKTGEVITTINFPDLHTIDGTYIDFDPDLWNTLGWSEYL